jgi:hypothetical protein
MFYVLLSVFFGAATILFILSNSINIFPEIFFFSWLVKNGFVPYRDYFDDHGFLVHMLLAPFTGDKTLLSLRVIYIAIHCINLGLILFIIRKTQSKISFIIGGLLYVLLMFFFSENDLWFELFITTFYLVAYIFLISKKLPGQFHLTGIFIGLATLVKPTAAFVLLPILLLRKNMNILIGFIFVMAITAVYFSYNNGYSGLFDANFAYNSFLSKYYRPNYLQDTKLILTSLGISALCAFLAFKNRTLNHLTHPFIFLLSSVIFLASGYTRVRLVPLATFFPILIATTYPVIKKKWKLPFILLICTYTTIMAVKVYKHHVYLLTNRPPYISQQDGQDIVSFIKKNNIKDTFFVLGNTVQPYYLLDQLPPTYIPLRYPMVEKYYPDYEERLIRDIQKNSVRYIFIPRPNEFVWKNIPTFINENYSLVSQSGSLEVYKIE